MKERVGGGEVAQIKRRAVFTVAAKKTKATGVGAENGVQQKHLTRMWYRSVCSLWTTEIISKACTYIQLTSYCRRAHVPLDKVSFNQGLIESCNSPFGGLMTSARIALASRLVVLDERSLEVNLLP